MEDLALLNNAQVALLRILSEEENFWSQNSKEKWLAKGDRNTNFFHYTVTEKHSRLKISHIKDSNGCWMQNEDQMKSETLDFFNTLLMDDGTSFQHQGEVEEFLSYIPSLLLNQTMFLC